MDAASTRTITWRTSEICRKAAAQGAVLLENKDGMLPLLQKDSVAVFGRCQTEYYRSGTGSGGSVNVPYITNILQGLKEDGIKVNEALEDCYVRWLAEHPFDNGGGGWACEPWHQQEMPLSKELVEETAAVSDKAVVVIGRTAGEDKDNMAVEGSYFLTADEKELLLRVCGGFENVAVVLNVANIIDMSFVEEYPVKAVVYAWQGGMEGGRGIADVLTGRETFQGHLTDTIAASLSDYPSHRNHGGELKNIYQEDIYVGYRYFETFARGAVRYPFGYGLSYTEFEIYDSKMEKRGSGGAERLLLTCRVRNKGVRYSGRTVLQLYVEKPGGGMGRPARELIAFTKTKNLGCREEEEVKMEISMRQLASFDDSGESGYKDCYVLEKGEYHFHLGENVRDTKEVLVDKMPCLILAETRPVEQCREAMAPIEHFERMRPLGGQDGSVTVKYEAVPVRTVDLRERIAAGLPRELPCSGDRGLRLKDVAEGGCSMEDFIAQLSPEDLAAIVRGEGMCSIKVTPGTAAAFGGVSDNLWGFGIPVGCCADGPSGIRMDNGSYATQVPVGTLLACTWDEALVEELFGYVGSEMAENQVDVLLGPGVNIHRHPLNGRNFEYFSEDPLVSGKMAAAVVRGIEAKGVHATVKHFACNSQETGRHRVDSVVSQRALREIYLRAFEIAVKEGNARSVMTSYNPVNGYWTASAYDLTTTILRDEWGFQGIVMTDWWADMNDVTEGGEGSKRRTADMVRAQNDVYMVVSNNGAEINANGDDTLEALESERLTLGELQRSAMNLCRFLIQTPAFARKDNDTERIPLIAALSGEDRTGGPLGTDGRISWNTNVQGRREFAVETAGVYDVIARIMSPHSNRSQAVCKAVLNGDELVTFQTNGTSGKWIRQKLLRVRLEKGCYQMELQFPKPGMVVDYLEFVLCSVVE
mgnify:CR=1 FL=1